MIEEFDLMDMDVAKSIQDFMDSDAPEAVHLRELFKKYGGSMSLGKQDADGNVTDAVDITIKESESEN